MTENAEPQADRYQLLDRLGVGSTSTVYRAIDRETGAERAVKVLSSAMALHESMRDRFFREAAMTARLLHPNIVRIYDAGEADGSLFIVMDLVRGGTLEQVVEMKGPIPARKAASIVQRILHALHHSHAQGVVHRDVNPGNIMLTVDGTPRLVDFGLGRAFGRDPRVSTDPGSVLGTFGYMAPEQGIDSGHVDNRADIFGAGATLYAVLTGHRPNRLFDTDGRPELWEGVPGPLVAVIQRATRYQPDERFSTAAEMAEALAAAHELLPPLTPEEEATIMVKPSAPDDTVVRKQLNLSNIVPPGQVKVERQRRRDAARQARAHEEAPTREMAVIKGARKAAVAPEPDHRAGLPFVLLGLALVLAVGLLWWVAG